MLALASLSIAVVRCATPGLPVAIGRPGSSPPRSLPKQAFNTPRQQTASVEISIASDAPPSPHLPRFPPLEVCGRRPRCAPLHLHGPASANLHRNGHRGRKFSKEEAARRRLLNSDLIILETTGAKTDNDTHVAKKSLCKVSPLAQQRPCKFHNTRTGTENCRDVDCRLGRDRTHSSRRLDQQLIRRRKTVAGRRSVLLDISRTCDSRCARRSLLRTFPETINRQQ